MTVSVVPALAAHVGPIADRMRAADVTECAMAGHEPAQALALGLAGSLLAWTALVDDRPEAMFGVVPVSLLDGLGRPWMLGTDAVPRHARAIVAHGPAVVCAMRERFGRLENCVDGSNRAAVRMLRWLGFDVSAVGPTGLHPFSVGG